MHSESKRSQDTSGRLLEAACAIFAEKGYHEATIAEICERAEANIAAVNYHFGDKATLYAEAWKLAFRRSLEAHPPDGGVPPEAPPEQRLRGRIQALMERIADANSHEFEIVHKEMANPTGLLGDAMRENIEQLRQGLMGVVRELLGEPAPDLHVILCQMSIKAQCFDVMRRRHHRIHRNMPRPPSPWAGELDIPLLAEHVTRFSLAGIREVRRQIECGAALG